MEAKKTLQFYALAIAVVSLPVSLPVCHAAIGLYLVGWLSEGRWRERGMQVYHNPLLLGYLFFLILHVVGILYSSDKSEGWFDLEKKAAFFILPMTLSTTFSIDRKSAELLFRCFVYGCLAISLFCLASAFQQYMLAGPQHNFDSQTLSLYQQFNPAAKPAWMFFSYIGLASGVGIHPTYLAMYLAFCNLLLIYFHGDSITFYSRGKKAGLILLYVYFSIFIVLLSSRIAILATILISLGGAWCLIPRTTHRWLTSVLIASSAFLTLSINPVARYRSLQEPLSPVTYAPSGDGTYAFSTGIRKSLWELSLDAIARTNPLFGAGTGDVKKVMKNESEEQQIQNIIGTVDPHNQFLYTQIGLGVLGLLTLLFCLYLPAWIALRQRNFLYLGFLFLFTLVCFTESALELQKGIVFFSIFNSLLVFPHGQFSEVLSKKLSYG